VGQPLGPKVKARPFNIRPEKVGLTEEENIGVT